MKLIRTEIPDVLILEPKVFGDARGFFLESYNKRVFRDATGLDVEFLQDNHSSSRRGVLRGLHYQIRQAQGKLVRVIAGEVFDVAVDLRRGSRTFGRCASFNLDSASPRMGKDAAYLLDSSKLRGSLGWRDQVSLEAGLDECIGWVKANLDELKKQPQSYVHKA